MTNATKTALDAMSGPMPIRRNVYVPQGHALDQWRYRMLRRVLRDIMRQHSAAQRQHRSANARHRLAKTERLISRKARAAGARQPWR